MLLRLVLSLALPTIPATAADPFYIGKWKIVSAVVRVGMPWKPAAIGLDNYAYTLKKQ